MGCGVQRSPKREMEQVVKLFRKSSTEEELDALLEELPLHDEMGDRGTVGESLLELCEQSLWSLRRPAVMLCIIVLAYIYFRCF